MFKFERYIKVIDKVTGSVFEYVISAISTTASWDALLAAFPPERYEVVIRDVRDISINGD